MASTKSLVIFFLMMALCGVSMTAVYDVGDSAGWTSMGHVDYQDWAANRNFHAGDILVFNYNNQFHNVKQVTRPDFESCNATSPIATYINGSDAITLERPGHFYFICDFPGHCLAGQKIDILVIQTPPNPSPAPYGSSPFSSPSAAQTSASSLYFNKLSWALSIQAFYLLGFAY